MHQRLTCDLLHFCRTHRIVICSVAVISAMLLVTTADAAEGSRPNIIFIMADDMGYGDPGCYNSNSKAPTPSIDRLAAEGMRFTDAHAPASVCVPTRFGLMTGRYPMRSNRNPRGPWIQPNRLTVGKLLQQNGYRTACVGKWHLGFEISDYADPLKGGPVDRGFDQYFGIPASLDIPPYYYIANDRAVAAPTETIGANYSEGVTRIQGAFWREGGIAPGFKHVDVLPKFTEKSVAFINELAPASSEEPFFLYVALPAPHTPWLPIDPFVGKSRAGDYGDFVVQVDATVGAILEALEQNNAADNTLIFFTSDNGPVWYAADEQRYDHECVGPLRGMKGDAWEGGHRMPFVARWPGQIPSGSISDEVICHTDMLATFAAILDEKLPADAGGDSYNILPALLGQPQGGPIREATIHQSSRKVLAIRQGDWKLIPALGSGGFSEPRTVDPKPNGPQGQLYNMRQDLGETNNVWSEHPDIVKRLTDLLKKYQREDRSVVAR